MLQIAHSLAELFLERDRPLIPRISRSPVFFVPRGVVSWQNSSHGAATDDPCPLQPTGSPLQTKQDRASRVLAWATEKRVLGHQKLDFGQAKMEELKREHALQARQWAEQTSANLGFPCDSRSRGNLGRGCGSSHTLKNSITL